MLQRKRIVDKEPAEDILLRINDLRSEKQQITHAKRNRELLKQLPQGPGSGLDADTVDKMHAEEIIEEARKGLSAGGGSGGGGGMREHGNEFHDPDFLSEVSVHGNEKHDPDFLSEVPVHGADKHDHTVWFAAITPLGGILPESNPPAQEKITGTNFTYYVLDFDKATAESVYSQFKLPENYTPGASLKVVIQWLSTVTSGAVKWAAQLLGRADAEAFDSALCAEQTVTTTTDGTAGHINTSEITFSSPDLAAEDIFILRIRRVADDGADTMDADARMIMAGVKL